LTHEQHLPPPEGYVLASEGRVFRVCGTRYRSYLDRVRKVSNLPVALGKLAGSQKLPTSFLGTTRRGEYKREENK
jgi:hypothetical protein